MDKRRAERAITLSRVMLMVAGMAGDPYGLTTPAVKAEPVANNQMPLTSEEEAFLATLQPGSKEKKKYIKFLKEKYGAA